MSGMKNQDFVSAPSKCMDPPPVQKKIRLYQAWKGRNNFLWGGRLILGPDARSIFLSAFLIGAPALTFCIKMALKIPTLDFYYGRAVFCTGLVLTILDLAFLFLTSARDPGIVPRNTTPPDLDNMSDSMASVGWMNGSAPPDYKLPRTKDIIVHGHKVKVKYCDTCLLYRPPRASHCSICNNCVQRFDHHCPWVGQCIGVRNYSSFILFITTSTALCIYVFTFSLINILSEPGWLLTAMSHDVVSVFLIAYCFIAVWFVGGLSVLHFYLMCTNQTTYENFRYRYDRKENPYNQGVIKNLKEILFSKAVPSLINLREWVAEEVDPLEESISMRFGGDVVKSNKKTDLEVGILGKDGKPLAKGIEDGLKKDIGGGKVVSDPLFVSPDRDEKDVKRDDDHWKKSSSQKHSSVELDR